LAFSNYCERFYSSKFHYVTYHKVVNHTTLAFSNYWERFYSSKFYYVTYHKVHNHTTLAFSNYCERLYSSKFYYVNYYITPLLRIAKRPYSILANSIASLIAGCWSHHIEAFKLTIVVVVVLITPHFYQVIVQVRWVYTAPHKKICIKPTSFRDPKWKFG